MKLKALCLGIMVAISLVMVPPISAYAEQKESVKKLNGEYAQTYNDVLQQIRSIIDIASSNPDLEPEMEGAVGVLESCKGENPAQTFNRIGYVVLDINMDGVPELVIGEIEERFVYAVYTQSEGKIYCAVEGFARNRFHLLDDGSLFNEGANGAIYSIFGRYILHPHENAIICCDYYFTHEKDETFAPGYYHNTSGIFDKSVSQPIAEDEYDGAYNSYIKRIKTIQLTPLAEQWGKMPLENTPY